MTRLEELQQMKKEIEAEISRLKNELIICGNVKFDKEHYPTSRPDDYIISVKVETRDIFREEQRKTIFRAVLRDPDRQKVIDGLDPLITDLCELRKKLKEIGE